jgi:hypothetical protein
MKEDLKILEKPRVLNAQRADILAQVAAIVLLLRTLWFYRQNYSSVPKTPAN